MLSFENDYTMGAHPQVLQRLIDSNFDPQPGYGNDRYCAAAKEKIAALCDCSDAQVHFLVGGTQTNALIIRALLKSYEGVIAASTAHIAVHEAGAVEATGHKVLTLPEHDGKIRPEEVQAYIDRFYQDASHTHMVYPGMVYISHPTELGTLYSKRELQKLSEICRNNGLSLFLDGARLGYGLASKQTDVRLADIAQLCDVFSIGGTKVGALCGEAVVFPKNNTPRHFLTMVKSHGALLAKGRLLGLQFDALFTDGLYFAISAHAIEMAEKLKALFTEKGYRFAWQSPTNQQFFVFENAEIERLREQVRFDLWERIDDTQTVVRFATSWATQDSDIAALRALL
ncbi:MAG: aminotransferase class V-fold PLP-dependent enzyme [Oscillospiraceae bacterium]|jgi:threonine aldolase|nr:aminotransferase class V-fold PLP-dependent enzyme [Oscillospiraceae bacterium]